MDAEEPKAADIVAAMNSMAWLLWRSAICDGVRRFQTVHEKNVFLREHALELLSWIKGQATIPTDYCACYEQVSDFATAMGKATNHALMCKIILAMEKEEGSFDTYDTEIQGLLTRFGVADTPYYRMNMERVHAAAMCCRLFIASMTDDLKDTNTAPDMAFVDHINVIVNTYTNVVSSACLPEDDVEGKNGAKKRDPAKPVSDKRMAHVRRRSTRKNLLAVQNEMILERKKQIEENIKKGKRPRPRRIKLTDFVKSSDMGAQRKRTGSLSRMPWKKKKPQHKVHAREESEGIGERGINLHGIFDDTTVTYEKGTYARTMIDQMSTSSSSSEPQEVDVEQEEGGEEVGVGGDIMMEPTVMLATAEHFVNNAWIYIEQYVSDGMVMFLGAYKFPHCNLVTSEEMRIETVLGALLDYRKCEAVVAIVNQVCRDDDTLIAKFADARDSALNQRGERGWMDDNDRHAMLMVLFGTCGLVFLESATLMARDEAMQFSTIYANRNVGFMLRAAAIAFEEHDRALDSLRHPNAPTPEVLPRSRSESQIPHLARIVSPRARFITSPTKTDA